MLTPNERTVLYHLANAWNVFVKLPWHHPDAIQEFRQAIHTAQYLISYRSARRADPDVWSQATAEGVPYTPELEAAELESAVPVPLHVGPSSGVTGVEQG